MHLFVCRLERMHKTQFTAILTILTTNRKSYISYSRNPSHSWTHLMTLNSDFKVKFVVLGLCLKNLAI